MKKPGAKNIFLTGLTLIMLSPILRANDKDESLISVSNGWIREAPPGATMLAGYFSLHNASGQLQKLISISSPLSDHVMMHHSVQRNGVVTMVHLDAVEIKSDGKLIFEPGGRHLMFMHPKKSIRQGQIYPVVFRFSSGKTIRHDFVVRRQ